MTLNIQNGALLQQWTVSVCE